MENGRSPKKRDCYPKNSRTNHEKERDELGENSVIGGSGGMLKDKVELHLMQWRKIHSNCTRGDFQGSKVPERF